MCPSPKLVLAVAVPVLKLGEKWWLRGMATDGVAALVAMRWGVGVISLSSVPLSSRAAVKDGRVEAGE